MTDAEISALADRIADRMLAADVLDLQGAAALLQLHPNTIRAQATAGVIPGFKFGKCWRFRRAALLDTITPMRLPEK